jgi:uncharacterized protein
VAVVAQPSGSGVAGFSGRWAEFILRARIPILIVAMGLTVFLGGQSTRLRSVWNEQEELPAGDPEISFFRGFLERFGGQEFLLVILQTDEVFTPDFLGYLRDLTDVLRDVPHAADVVSLATVPAVRGAADELRIEPLFSEISATPEAAARLRAEALGNPLWAGSLISADGRTACINVMLPSLRDDVNERIAAVAAAQELLRRNPHPGVRTFVTGFSPLTRDMLATLRGDLLRFLLLTPPVILACLFWAFRTWRGLLAPALAIALSMLWSLGLLAVSGGTLNFCTILLPTLVAINCLSYSIHLLNAYHESCARGGEHREILRRTMIHQAPALAMAAFTTAIGFGSLALSDIRSLRQLGIFSGAGILLAFLLCMVLIPVLLSFLPLPAKKAHRHRSVRSLRGGLWRVAAVVNRDTWKIPLLLALLLGLSAAGIARIRDEMQLSRTLPESAPSIQGMRVAEESLAGFYVLELELEGGPGAFREPWALRELDRLQRQVAGMAGVDQVVSVNDLLREAHRVRHPESAAAGSDSLPETAGQIAEYRLLFSMSGQEKLQDSLLTADGSAARLSARLRTLTTADHLKLIADIENFAQHSLDPRLKLRTTGAVKLFAVRIHALVRSLFRSFGLSFLLIAVLMSIQLRSAKAGFCSMIPNVLPIVLGFGLMGFLGISLSASTVMIASVGIGIAVDDTIHVLLRYRRELLAGCSPAGAVRRTLLGVGRAMVYSSLGLSVGFSILMTSRFRPNREFGMLIAFILIVALLADLFATPYLVRAFRLFQRKKP